MGRSTLETLFSDHEVTVDLRWGKANNKTPRSFAKLDPVFTHDNSGRSVLFSIKEESKRLDTSSPFSKDITKRASSGKNIIALPEPCSRRRPQGLRTLLRLLTR